MAEVDASNWLTNECLELLERRGASREHLPEKGVIRGKTFIPCLRQLYLLKHAPFVEELLDENLVADLAATTGYNKIKLMHYYTAHGGNRLPQPFIIPFLGQAVSISTSSVENVLKTLATINMVQTIACEFESRAKAIKIDDSFHFLVEHWIKMKLDGVDYE